MIPYFKINGIKTNMFNVAIQASEYTTNIVVV